MTGNAKGFNFLNSVYLRVWQTVTGFVPLKDNNGFFNSPAYFLHTISRLLKLGEGGETNKDENNNETDEEFLDEYFGILLRIKEGVSNFDKVIEEVKHSKEKTNNRFEFQAESKELINKFLSGPNTREDFQLEKTICNILIEDFEIEANFFCLDTENHPILIRGLGSKKDLESFQNLLIFPNGHVALYYTDQEMEDLIVKNISDSLTTDDKEKSLAIPTYLHDHVKKMIPTFVQNAVHVAYSYEEGESYKIATSGSVKKHGDHHYDSIISVDLDNTGMLHHN